MNEPGAFDTHQIDNRFADMQLNKDLMDEANRLANEKAKAAQMTDQRMKKQHEEARKIRQMDDKLFGDAEEA